MTPTTLDEWLTYIDTTHPRDIELGLDRVRSVAERLGALQPAPRCVIVAGTNGKGSTCIALEALAMKAGLRTGTTLSPHVERFNERVRVDGRMLDDDHLCGLFARVEAGRGDIRLTYFEMAALVALLAFRDAAVDLAILEVGLGGRLDAFNVVDADLAVVTSIGLDHQEFLGDDVEQIGREKAGVFRAGRPVVLGAVTASVVDAAAELGCPAWRLGEDFRADAAENPAAQSWRFVVPAGGRTPFAGTGLTLELPLGPLAPANCALALVAAAALLGAEVIDAAPVLGEAALPGRLEVVEYRGRRLLVDVAHNPAGAVFLAAELGRRHTGTRFTAVLSVLRDKDAAGIADALGGHVARWIAAPSAGARGQDAGTLADRLGSRRMEIAGTFEAALDLAVSSTPAEDGILVVGSFSAVEQVRGLCRKPAQHSGGAASE